jgi:hypothetical protein
VARQRFTVSTVYGHAFDAGELARLAERDFELRPEPSTYSRSWDLLVAS